MNNVTQCHHDSLGMVNIAAMVIFLEALLPTIPGVSDDFVVLDDPSLIDVQLAKECVQIHIYNPLCNILII